MSSRRSRPRTTPIGAVARGAVAGAAGTLAMDLLWYSRARRGGDTSSFTDWELSSGLASWDEAPPPAQIGRRLFEGFTQRELPGERARLVNNLMHWAYGTFWGAQYGVLAGSLPRPRLPWPGVVFGALVFASDYVVLPAAGVYQPIWEYDRVTLAKDLSAHVLFGAVTDAVLRAITPAA